MKKILYSTVFSIMVLSVTYSQAIIINHESAFLEPIPEWAIKLASDSLHIAYGHTSHGSQLTTGMKALALQSTSLKGYKGDFYCWEDYYEVYGDNPCLDIDDKFVPGDLGHNGDTGWADRTRDYLLNKERAKDINVVMWSWCGGCSDNTDEGIQKYLNAMNNLEADFPDIVFVYMTGHLDHNHDERLKHNNQLIREYCIANNKVLFDFADIESYDPDGKYFEFSNDNCDYFGANGDRLGNWAKEWQDSHEHGVDWYICSAAHTKPLNGNRKAYASWWLWARLVGWNPEVNTVEITSQPENIAFCDNGMAEFSVNYNNADSLRWQKMSPDDTVFTDIYDNGIYTKTDSKTLQITFENDSLNGYYFRALVYLNNSFVKSDSALLTIDKFVPAKTKGVDETCSDTIILKGNNPYPGTCKWTVFTGNSQIDTSTNFTAMATGISLGENIFQYTVENGLCKDTAKLQVYRYGEISITKQPTDISISNLGIDTTFEVKVQGDIEFIQWYKNDEVLSNSAKYLGVNSLKLVIRNIQVTDKGKYHCDINGHCNDLSSNEVTLDVLSATQNEDKNEIKVYPNPTTGIIHFVSGDEDINTIRLYNTIGQMVFSVKNNGLKNGSIDISNLKNGIYIYKWIKDNNPVLTGRILLLK